MGAITDTSLAEKISGTYFGSSNTSYIFYKDGTGKKSTLSSNIRAIVDGSFTWEIENINGNLYNAKITQGNLKIAAIFDVTQKSVSLYENGDTPTIYQKENSEHTHTFSAEWSTNAEKHWHEDTCEHTSEKSAESDHIFVNVKCSVCDFDLKYEKLEIKSMPVIYINPNNPSAIIEKEIYESCLVSIESNNSSDVKTNLSGKIKGRGNSTWTIGKEFGKKPYRIKLDAAADLFGLGSEKDWVLLANLCDKSLIRNDIAFSLATVFPNTLSETSKFKSVELMLNGKYQGVYLLCEQNEVGINRVNISETTDYLLELDIPYLYTDADSLGIENVDYFSDRDKYGKTENNLCLWVVKSPDTAKIAESRQSTKIIMDFMEQVFEALDKKNNKTWADVENILDVESFVDSYIIDEIMQSSDISTSSFYVVKDSKDKLRKGPLWDYDNALKTNIIVKENFLYAAEYNAIYNKLFTFPEFKSRVKQKLIEKKNELENKITECYNTAISQSNSYNRNFDDKWQIVFEQKILTSENPKVTEIKTWQGQLDYVKQVAIANLNFLAESSTQW